MMSKDVALARDPGLVCRRWKPGEYIVVAGCGSVIGKGASAAAAWKAALQAEQQADSR